VRLIGVGLGVKMNVDFSRARRSRSARRHRDQRVPRDERRRCVAAGDIAEFFDVSIDCTTRWAPGTTASATDASPAQNMLGERKFYNDVPMYSTGLFDSRIRVMGLTAGPTCLIWKAGKASTRRTQLQRLFFRMGVWWAAV